MTGKDRQGPWDTWISGPNCYTKLSLKGQPFNDCMSPRT